MEPTDKQGSPENKRRGWRRLGITVLLLAGFVVVAEVIVRGAVPSGRLLRLSQLDDVLVGKPQHQFLEMIQDDRETFWKFAPNVVLPAGSGPFFGRISNDQGLRETEHIEVPKKPGEVRVLFLGDSCTFGYLLDERHTFVAMTEERLHKRFPGKSIECINAGVPGYTAYQCWRKLMTEGFDYQPDLVVMQFGWNERIVWPDGRSDAEHYRALQACTPPGVLASSRLCQLLWTYARWPAPADDGRARLAPAEFRRVLQRIADALEERNVGFLLLVTGCRQNVGEQSLTQLQGEQLQFAKGRLFGPQKVSAFVNGVTELTRLTLKKGRPVEDLLFDEAHPTMAYSEILADVLVDKIVPWLAGQ